MRKLPYLLSALGAALTAGAAETAAPQRIIDIRTDDISLILSAAPGEEVRFLHFGGRIDDPAPLAGYRSYRHPDHNTEDVAYPAFGGRNYHEPALRVTHADGDLNTELRYVSHRTRQLADDNVTETVVRMTDAVQRWTSNWSIRPMPKRTSSRPTP